MALWENADPRSILKQSGAEYPKMQYHRKFCTEADISPPQKRGVSAQLANSCQSILMIPETASK
jgi:hypothetical protein